VRIREDRKKELESGKYYGNNYKIAENIWMTYENILNIEEEEEDRGYFEIDNNELQKVSRNYNSYVKNEIFKSIMNSEWVMDLASGKGQDLFRYSEVRVKNIIFLEIDKMAIEELIARKHIYSNDSKYRNSMRILIQNVDLIEDYKMNIRKIERVYNRNRSMEVIMCNFAFHYMMRDRGTLENIIKMVEYYIKRGGRFIILGFDGEEVNEIIKENNEWIVRVNNNIKYGIKKEYEGKKVEGVGQKIKVILPFSNGKYYEEYLINEKEVTKECEKYNMELIKKKSFIEYGNMEKLDEYDRKYTKLYYMYEYKKR